MSSPAKRRRTVKKTKSKPEPEVKAPIATAPFDAHNVVDLVTEWAAMGRKLSPDEINTIQALLQDQNLKLQMRMNVEAVVQSKRLSKLMELQDDIEGKMVQHVEYAETRDLVAMHRAIQARYRDSLEFTQKQSQGAEIPSLIALLQNIAEKQRIEQTPRRIEAKSIEDLAPHQRESVRSALEQVFDSSSEG